MRKIYLVDDGTLDTVFECETCEQQIRYSEFARDDDGSPLEDDIDAADMEHADECEGPQDTSHYELASRWHGGQWSALYAFLSSGTVTHGLAKEIRTCINAAHKQKEHEVEISSLEEFATWAQIEEDKLSD